MWVKCVQLHATRGKPYSKNCIFLHILCKRKKKEKYFGWHGSSSVGKSSKFPNIWCTFPLIGRDAWLLWLAGMLGSRKVWDMTAQRIQKSEFFLAAKAATLLHNSLRHAWHHKEFRNQKSSQLLKLLFYYITVWDMTAQRIQKSEIRWPSKTVILLHIT